MQKNYLTKAEINKDTVLLLLFGISIPFSVALTNVLAVCIFLFFLYDVFRARGNFNRRIQDLFSQKLVLYSVAFFTTLLVSLLWTEDLASGMHYLGKYSDFIWLLPALFYANRKTSRTTIATGFIIGMSISICITYLIWLGLLEPFKYATHNNPVPFGGHISFSPMAAISAYFLLSKALFDHKKVTYEQITYLTLGVLSASSVFLTQGRSGHVGMLALLLLLLVRTKKSIKTKTMMTIPILMVMLVALNSQNFTERMNGIFEGLNNIHLTTNNPIGERIDFAVNTLAIIEDNPALGVGIGDYPDEYKKKAKERLDEQLRVNRDFEKGMQETSHPHNMYLLISAQAGVFGMLPFLLFLSTAFLKLKSINEVWLRESALGFLFLFVIIMLSDSYLLGHYTTMTFMFLLSAIFAQRTNEKNE